MTKAIRVSKYKSGVGNQCATKKSPSISNSDKIVHREKNNEQRQQQQEESRRNCQPAPDCVHNNTNQTASHDSRGRENPALPIHLNRARTQQSKRSRTGRNQGDTQDGIQSHKSTGWSLRRIPDGVSCPPPPGPNCDRGGILQDLSGAR